MGKSTSCFKISTCGGHSADNDDLEVSEKKGSNDKRGWSFRKRSGRHQVLSNSVISETPPSIKKENLELIDINFQPPNISNVPEKTSMIPPSDEKTQFSTPVEGEPKASETIVDTDTESKDDSALEESVVIVIQTAVRWFLAKRELLKLKNVVKLQAAVRGHLVRRHAVGTLRCVQALIKMQVLVRARRACFEKEVNGKSDKGTHNSITSKKGSSIPKPNATGTSIENLLRNGFARQLMESTPKNKPIHFKCDPTKQDSAWRWLERWMSVSVTKQTAEAESRIEQPENEKNKNFAPSLETQIPSDVLSDLEDTKSNIKEIVLPSESEENLITYDMDNFSFQQSQLTSLLRDGLELSHPEKTSTPDVNGISVEINSHQNQITQSHASSEQESASLLIKPEKESEQPKRPMKRFASENLETEGSKFIYGSRKSSNPTFGAVQTKFDMLSLSANSGRSISSQHQDISIDSNIEKISSRADTSTRTNLCIIENSVSRIQYGGSECGTELSVSSTLDSPDGSEVGTTEYEHEAKVAEKEVCDPNNSNNSDIKASEASMIPICVVSDSVVDHVVKIEKVDDVRAESANSGVVIDTPLVEHKPKSGASKMYKERELEKGRQTYRSSPEASSRCHITVPESQGTPLSQVSVKAKSNRTDKTGSNRKLKPLSASKGSPSNPNHDSGARSITEQLPRDQKIDKRHNSFSASKTDTIDQEPGDHSGSNFLPHFMQATESARAKIQANNSPRSSPDVQDRDSYIKKRYSLPVGNGRQGSPCIQRPASEAQQGTKGNETQALHDRKWQR